MNLKDRISAFTSLGKSLEKANLHEIYELARAKNDWFTGDMVEIAISSIYSQMLNKSKLEDWISKYSINEKSRKNVALVLAGNIPAVGFHDILCVLMFGHNAVVKLSSKDPILIPFMLSELINLEPRFNDQIKYTDKLVDFDAVIATGSANSNVYFQHYFGEYPSIIRSNRKSIGVIFNTTSDDDLRKLCDDIFLFYGLGCRNISKLFIEEGVDLENIMTVFHERNNVILHNKYKNNYDYNYTVSLLNGDDFLMSGSMILRKDESLHSRIATVHYERFSDIQEIVNFYLNYSTEIQCVISSQNIDSFETIKPGQAQFPSLSDYADQIDTVEFLNAL